MDPVEALTDSAAWLIVLFALVAALLCLLNARRLTNSHRVVRYTKAFTAAGIGAIYALVASSTYTTMQVSPYFRALLLVLMASLIAREIIEAPPRRK